MGNEIINGNIDVSADERQTSSSFAEEIASTSIGPEARLISPPPAEAAVAVYTWSVMKVGTVELKNALYDFINTTKDGQVVAPDYFHGREKKLTFNFYGTMGKTILPGEIGEFDVIFSYPPDLNALKPVPSTNFSSGN